MSYILFNNLPDVVWKCCKEPSAFVAISTFLVTPGAQIGRHLQRCQIFSNNLPEIGCWHFVFHVLIKNVTLLLSEYVENSNGTITTTCCDILVVVVKPYAVGRG